MSSKHDHPKLHSAKNDDWVDDDKNTSASATTTTAFSNKKGSSSSTVAPLFQFRVMAPGRICFFGEHSDYLGFPVIARAIPLYCTLDVTVEAIVPAAVTVTTTTTAATATTWTSRPNTDDDAVVVMIHLHVPPEMGPSKLYNIYSLPPSPSAAGDDEPVDFALAAIHEVLQEEGWDLSALCRQLLVQNDKNNNNETTTTSSSSNDTAVEFHIHCHSSSGPLPLQAGCSSSTAFLVAWVLMLAKLANRDESVPSPIRLAQLAHRAEVTHFGHPGGTMDHVSIALGTTPSIANTVAAKDDIGNDNTNRSSSHCGGWRIGPGPWQLEALPFLSSSTTSEDDDDGMWILADSGEPKDTLKHLRRCKYDRLQLLQHKLGGDWDCDKPSEELTETEQTLWETTLINRKAEEEASQIWKMAITARSDNDNERSTGQSLALLMKRHHEALRDGLGLSTAKLESMNKAALESGAWGFKVVGSGGGGCGVAWAPTLKAKAVAAAMTRAGAKTTWIFQCQQSVRGAHIASCHDNFENIVTT